MIFHLIVHIIAIYLNLNSFRKMWPINYYGKWTDNDYTSPIYPMFACGSGYILTRDIIDWIILNNQYLFRYQVNFFNLFQKKIKNFNYFREKMFLLVFGYLRLIRIKLR